MSRKRKLGIATGAICLLLCTFGAFAYAEPQLLLANSTTELNELFNSSFSLSIFSS